MAKNHIFFFLVNSDLDQEEPIAGSASPLPVPSRLNQNDNQSNKTNIKKEKEKLKLLENKKETAFKKYWTCLSIN